MDIQTDPTSAIFVQDYETVFADLTDGLKIKSLIQWASADQNHGLCNDTYQGPRAAGAVLSITRWDRYLNELSHLCQFENGGHTVTAIAVAASEPQSIFWVAMNKDTRSQSVKYLTWILDQLKQVPPDGDLNRAHMVEMIAETISCATVNRSTKRIRNYQRILRLQVDEMKADHRPSDASYDSDLSQALNCLADPKICYQNLTRLAYEFPRTREYQTLVHKAATNRTGYWNLIRHFLGRLASWHKAARFLAINTQRFAHILDSHCVEAIPRFKGTSRTIKSVAKIEDLLAKCFPSLRGSNILRTTAKKMNTSRLAKRMFNDEVLVLHAEAAVLYHFYRHNLTFVDGNISVGCSKPSCYCCSLYFEELYGGSIQRPSHQRCYAAWLPPEFATDGGEGIDIAAVSRLRSMGEKVRNDVWSSIQHGGQYGNKKGFDSTTGISRTMESLFR